VKYRHLYLGGNSRLDEMQAAVLRVKLNCLDEDNAWRRRLARRYREGIYHPRIRLPHVANEEQHVWHVFVVRCSHRDALQQHLRAHGIQTQVHYPVPAHRQPAYAAMQNVSLPLTDQLHDEVLSLPMGPTLSDAAADQVIAACQSFVCSA
jgi:dTDP-4-amino-4,6-dideoxygalactose transaminase